MADFIGSGSALKQLNLRRADELELVDQATARIGEPTSEALARLREAGEEMVVIIDDKGHPRDWIFARQLERYETIPEPQFELNSVVDARSTLSDAMSAMLASSHSGALVTRRGEFVGVLYYETVTDYIQQMNAAAQEALDDKEVDSGGEI